MTNATTGAAGLAVRLLPDGRFDAIVKLAPGENVIEVRAHGAAGASESRAARCATRRPRTARASPEAAELLDTLRGRTTSWSCWPSCASAGSNSAASCGSSPRGPERAYTATPRSGARSEAQPERRTVGHGRSQEPSDRALRDPRSPARAGRRRRHAAAVPSASAATAATPRTPPTRCRSHPVCRSAGTPRGTSCGRAGASGARKSRPCSPRAPTTSARPTRTTARRPTGVLPFMQHPGLLEAARKVHDCAVVVPNIVYANLLLPGQELAVHTDVPEFRGANRKLYPQWLMVVMLHSGLFAPWRRKIATGIAYFGRAQGGALAFYPDGREGPARTLEARHNTAIVLDTDTVFHGVDRVRRDAAAPGAAAGHAPLLGGRRLARRPGGRARGALPARRGALLRLVEGLLLPRRGRAAQRGRAPRRPLARADPRHAEAATSPRAAKRRRPTRPSSPAC